MHLDDFDFYLPAELIAQNALPAREASRMLTLDRRLESFSDNIFSGLPELLRGDDIIVLNNTRVFPARLYGMTDTGASVEVFLVQALSANRWETLARPAKRLSPGKYIDLGGGLSGKVIDRTGEGRVVVEFTGDRDLDSLIDKVGTTPLPPYIKRERTAVDSDRERYQTVYAKNRGSIAAPTAGLHFTEDILDDLRSKGIDIVELTLHVGYGTFEPVRTAELSHHTVSSEEYEISEESCDLLNSALADGRRIIAVGTTSTRALESNINDFGRFHAGHHVAGLTIRPGYRFRAVSGLLTNFHLPRSSLLVLTATFGGHALIMDAYRHAVANKYRFYSYGDCMLIL